MGGIWDTGASTNAGNETSVLLQYIDILVSSHKWWWGIPQTRPLSRLSPSLVVLYIIHSISPGIPYDATKSDVWSLGVVLYTIVCGRFPYDDTNVKKLLSDTTSGILQYPLSGHRLSIQVIFSRKDASKPTVIKRENWVICVFYPACESLSSISIILKHIHGSSISIVYINFFKTLF